MTTVTSGEMVTLANGLTADPKGISSLPRLESAIGKPTENAAYLILGVLTARIPTDDDIRTFVREWRVSSLASVVARIPPGRRRRARHSRVRVADGVVVDVTDTARTPFTTGIQRVARETLRSWSGYQAMDLIAWDKKRQIFIGVDGAEPERATLNSFSDRGLDVIIPFRCALLLPEIAVDVTRAAALRAIAVHSASSTIAIGFDCIPVTTAETAGPGMPGAFSRYLSALARFTIVAPISEAAGLEYSGWRAMLAGAGLVGPEIRVVSLPSSVAPASTAGSRDTRVDLALGDGTIVLGVGSREPRKNHLNLLHACELNWQAGRAFTLVLVGGNAWESRRVDTLISDLQRRGRKIVTVARVDDDILHELYELSRFTVFCSINEGFGLPVVESLSHGTPVLTSEFGSMKQLGEGRGALLVDPHNPDAIAAGMARLLDDDTLLATLKSHTRGADGKTWDDYAREIHRLVFISSTAAN